MEIGRVLMTNMSEALDLNEDEADKRLLADMGCRDSDWYRRG